MERINNVISVYQEKISKYDKQLWERSVEQEVLKSLRSVPRKSAKVNPDLIDVDLVRGSTFTKAKPQHGWMSVSVRATLRVLFLPLYFQWWLKSTCAWMFGLLSFLYFLQIAALILWFADTGQNPASDSLSLAHLATPCVMMLILSVVHSQIVATSEWSSRRCQHQAKRKKEKTNRRTARMKSPQSTSEQESGGSRDTGIDLNPDDKISSAARHKKYKSYQRRKVYSANNVALSIDKDDTKARHTVSLEPTRSVAPTESESVKKLSEINSSTPLEKTSEWVRKHASEQFQPVESLMSNSRSIQGGLNECDESADGQEVVFGKLKENQSSPDLASLAVDSAATANACVSAVTVKQSGSDCIKPTEMTPDDVKDESVDNRQCDLLAGSHEDLQERNQADRQNIILVKKALVNSRLGMSHKQRRHEKSSFSLERRLPRQTRFLDDDYGSTRSDNEEERSFLAERRKVRSRTQRRLSPESISVANSNTSLSDTCNSSFVSSTEDNYSEKPANRVHGDPTLSLPFGLRQRKRVSYQSPGGGKSRDGHCTVEQSLENDRPKNDQCDPTNITEKERQNDPSLESVAQRCDTPAAHTAVPVISITANPMCSVGRQSSVKQTAQLCGDDVKAIPAVRQSHGRRVPNSLSVRIVDNRLPPESTGISSCDSEPETSPMTPNAPKIATSEWEDTINTEITSCTNSSSQASTESCSDLSEKDFLGERDNGGTQGIHHSTSILKNLASSSDRVSCMIWETEETQKVDLTVIDIGWSIIDKVDKMPQTVDYFVFGFIFSCIFMFMPVIYRMYHTKEEVENLNYQQIEHVYYFLKLALGYNWKQVVIVINGLFQRFSLCMMFFFLLSVAERTFKQRLLYAKNFCYLTSSRRARKYKLPHFRLNKVRNIKSWLSLRSFLKKRGPQRSVESIVSAAFIIAVILVCVLCIELLQGYGSFLDHLGNWELVASCLALGVFLLRFITLGAKINKKYRNFSVLITEQINLYLHMEKKPHKKEELMVANNVLKLAEELLKELESPFKISGLSANPILYNITKVVVLSAFSAVMTELLGFKLKLYKIKIRA